jgi:hypothetical protein
MPKAPWAALPTPRMAAFKPGLSPPAVKIPMCLATSQVLLHKLESFRNVFSTTCSLTYVEGL